MKAIILDIDVLYFCCFRKVTSTSLILTYLIPPFTTIRGFLSNAMGYKRDDFKLQEEIKLGILVKDFGTKHKELAKILKMKKAIHSLINPDFPSSPMFKEYLVKPKYKIFIIGQELIIKKLSRGLKNWKRPLYLGQSDDLIDLKCSEIIDTGEAETDMVNSVLSCFVENAVIEKIPYKFSAEGKSLYYKVLSIPLGGKAKLKEPIKAYKISDYFVEVF